MGTLVAKPQFLDTQLEKKSLSSFQAISPRPFVSVMLYDLHHRINSIFNAKRLEFALLHVACLIWLLVQSCCTLGLTGNACCYMHFFWPASVLSHDARDRRVVHDFFTTNNCLDVAQTFPDILQIYSTPNAGSPIAVIYRRLIAWPVSLQFPSHPKCRVPRQQDLLLFSIYVNDMIWIYVYIYIYL